jgi:CopG family nickel-responsive transcriptional regulator
MVVISASLPGDQLDEFDRIVEEMGYPSRSDALRDAIHRFVQDHRWIHTVGHGRHFLMSLLYNERSKDPVSDVLHRYRKLIHSAAHTHFDGKCADQLVLLGEGQVVADLVKELAAVRDVRVCNCIV